MQAPKRDFKNELLRIANAKTISKRKFYQLIDHHVSHGWPLVNRIINLPPEEEESMRNRLEDALKNAKNAFGERTTKGRLSTRGTSRGTTAKMSA